MSTCKDVLSEACKWWATKRPLSFSLEEHLKNPTVNTCTDAEKSLALTVAAYLAPSASEASR